jgi:guanylate kinase
MHGGENERMIEIVCLVGESGSGKTTLAERMAKYGYTQVYSYTTRPKRSEDEKGHIFVTQEEFDQIRDQLVAYTLFNGYEYGATLQQIKDHELYVIDPKGVEMLSKSIGRENIFVIYLSVNERQRFERLYRTRGGAVQAGIRIQHDREAFKDFKDYDLKLFNDHHADLKYNEKHLKSLLDQFFGGKKNAESGK